MSADSATLFHKIDELRRSAQIGNDQTRLNGR
jgi:hypothetical protein